MARIHLGHIFHLSGVNISAGTDSGAGDEWSIPQVLNAAFKTHISETGEAGVAMHPAEMLFLGTLGGARALDMEDRLGNFDAGKEADFVVVDPNRTAALKAVITQGVRSDDPTMARAQTLFGLLMRTRETSIAGTYVQGRRLHATNGQSQRVTVSVSGAASRRVSSASRFSA